MATLFVKDEGHNGAKISTGRWRLIWNISELDRLCDAWAHSDQDHYDVAFCQCEKGQITPLATGVGHDDRSIENSFRDLKWLKTRSAEP